MPDFNLEQSLLAQGIGPIAGVDEVGRGPLAGPVLAAAVILDPQRLPLAANDSKKMTAAKREQLFSEIMTSAQVGIGQASVQEIDDINILQATFLAMRRAIEALPQKPAMLLIDGNRAPDFGIPARTIISGDAKVLSIAAASIIAKVTRDRLMTQLAQAHPQYDWPHNAGYGTAKHLQALQQHGVTPHHRRTFRPISEMV
jgi:ribonuclease HII